MTYPIARGNLDKVNGHFLEWVIRKSESRSAGEAKKGLVDVMEEDLGSLKIDPVVSGK